jgi:Mg/Co/Ni transporter MgtE
VADLTAFEPYEGELRLAKQVLDHKLIDVRTRRLVRANEIELMLLDGCYEVVGVDTGARGFLRRLLPSALARAVPSRGFRDWSTLEPLTHDLPSHGGDRLRRLHPADLAHLVEASAHDEGEEIIAAIQVDPELQADLFEELDAHHSLEFIRTRSNADVALILDRMEPDAAADLLQSIAEDRRWKILALLPAPTRRTIRELLAYPPKTAGGLMTPQFICLYGNTAKSVALARLERSQLPPHVTSTLYVMNERRRLTGSVTLTDLLRSGAEQPLGEIAQPAPTRVYPDADLEELSRLMTDYNLTIVPVVDDHEQVIGVVTVDDVLALLLPTGWRRHLDLLGGD